MTKTIVLFGLVAALNQQPLKWTFEIDPLRALPVGWQLQGHSRSPVYWIDAESSGNRFIVARSRGSDVQLGLEVELKTSDYPMLSWRWRAWELPSQADETRIGTMDSAAAVYVVSGSRLMPRVLKYVWSTSLPAGLRIKHPRSQRVAILIIDSGKSHMGRWKNVSRNILTDSKAAFGEEFKNIRAIGVKTDSDSTSSSAGADYDDFVLGGRSEGSSAGEK